MSVLSSTRHRHSGLSAALASRVAIDARALAAFRIGLGCTLLLDLLLRLRNLRTFYTDAGVLPVSQLAEQSPLLARFSLHAQSGDAWFQALLFALAGIAAVALVVGYKTRLATLVSLGFLLSLHARNPHVLSAGDALLQHLLVWSLLLPLGSRWSVDAQQHETGHDRVVSLATAGLLVQVLLVYGVNAILKTRSEQWMTGEATATVFGLDRFTILLGPLLRDVPLVLDIGHWVWLALLLVSPLLVVTTGRLRTALVGAFAAMHLGMVLTLYIGIFPVVCLVALLPFLQTGVWETLARTRVARRLRPWLGRTVAAGADTLPRWSPARAALSGDTHRLRQSVAAAGLGGLVLFNAVALGFVPVPPPADDTSSGDRPEPRWTMFAPHPTDTDRWFVAPGNLSSGDRIDAFHQRDLTWERPEHIARTYSSARMRKYMSNLRYDDRLQRSFASHLCDRWSRTHETDLLSVSVYAIETPARAGDGSSRERIELVTFSCAASASPPRTG